MEGPDSRKMDCLGKPKHGKPKDGKPGVYSTWYIEDEVITRTHNMAAVIAAEIAA